MDRRAASLCVLMLVALVAACGAPRATPAPDTQAPIVGPAVSATRITLIRSPSCGCCEGHAQHLLRHGYVVDSQLTEAYLGVKDAHAIPADMRSCHTALVGRYFVEGHVPVAAIEQLLREQPGIDGIALPGMPAGSPGMPGPATGPLVVFAIADGAVVGEFGQFEAPID